MLSLGITDRAARITVHCSASEISGLVASHSAELAKTAV